MAFLAQLLIGIGLAVLSYLLTPKPKIEKPPAATDMEGPTASAGRPIPVVFGTLTLHGGNVLWFGDKLTNEYTSGGTGGKKGA